MSSRALPDWMRLMSSKSSMSCTCARALRSITSTACATSSGLASAPESLRMFAHPRMALSGVRSSWESVARNSSFNWLTRSPSTRAACSALKRFSRSFWARTRSVTSRWIATHFDSVPSASRSGVIRHSTMYSLPSLR